MLLSPRPAPALVLLAIAGATTAVSCAARPPRDWGDYDILKGPVPAAPLQVRNVDISAADYARLLELGEGWFRYGAFGNERSISDVMGVFEAEVEVPCGSPAVGAPAGTPAAPAADGCFEKRSALPYFFDAIDRLDGVAGNLFQGNGGADGTGYTADLVLYFPKGTRLYGSIPVPEELHTGLDVEAGSAFPIGIDPVPAPAADQGLEFLPDASKLGYAGAPEGKLRVRLACAACHYSLDVDNDGHADLRSARRDNPTPNSPWAPEDAWGVGNQDISFGWLFGLAQNPFLGAPVLAGAVGQGTDPDAAIAFLKWVLDNYESHPDDAAREVVAGMLAQPRGFADVTTDGIYNTMQIPTLYTSHAWPANSDGGQSAGSDRNNTVWTGALDFTGLIDLCGDRGSSVHLPWDPKNIFEELDCDTFAKLMTRWSPAVRWKPELQKTYMDDILGLSDGVPGMLDPNSVVVMETPTLPKAIVQQEVNVKAGRIRTPDDYGGDAPMRGAGMAALGMRIGLEEKYRKELQEIVDRYPDGHLDLDDLMNESVSVALDWIDPPPNVTPLLANSAGLVQHGHDVFVAAGCEQCHRGPYTTDNVIHSLSPDPREQFGAPRAPSTAGWRVLDRGVTYIETEPQRTWNTRNLRRFVSAPYDPQTGLAYRKGGPLQGFLSVQNVGYKTTSLRYLWGSAPYLHDGGVGVALKPGSAPAGDDLRAILKRAGGPDVIYGMAGILNTQEPDPSKGARANAALSLQALVLQSEREKVIAANEAPDYQLWPGSKVRVGGGEPLTRTSMDKLGVHGIGHDFYIQDAPGGSEVTALVAFLLALDDCPRDLPGQPSFGDCHGAVPYQAVQ